MLPILGLTPSSLLCRLSTSAPIFLAALVWPRLSLAGNDAEAADRPNVVVVIADDLGWADVGYHRQEIETPQLDQLAKTGVRLETHYVYPTCTPTRVGILSGRGPSRFGVYGPVSASKQVLPRGTVLLPAALREQGYVTHISGKWHIGSDPRFGPTKFGFASSYGYLHGQIDPYNHLYKFGQRSWHRNEKFFDQQGHATDLITNDAVRFIRENRERPFFLHVAYSVPHFPLAQYRFGPVKWTSRYDGKIKDPWRKLFAASVTHMDAGLGEIVKELDRHNLRRKTLVVFVSDNGGQKNWNAPKSQYDGRYQPHTTLGDNRPLRGWKGSLYEGGVRVPAVANWLGKLQPGQTLDAPTHVLDWYPTVCYLAGIEIKPAWRLEGENIWPQLTGQAAAKPRLIYLTGGRLAVRQGDWKLIANKKMDRVELFDLKSDPYETKDLAKKHPEQVWRLLQLLEAQRKLDS